MRSSEVIGDARRAMEICNACRYCEGYCAVFPAMERRRSFSNEDLAYLANLCHGCRGCYYACQYAPPHPFGLNLPKSFAELRGETYAEYAWPAAFGRLFRRSGLVVSLVTAVTLAACLVLVIGVSAPGALFAGHTGAGAFYQVLPKAVLVSLGGFSLGFALLALAMGALRFWRDAGLHGAGGWAGACGRALGDVLTLRNLGSEHGCNDRDETFSNLRRRLHHALFYGFLACFAATSVATLYEDLLGWPAPYGLFSLPVLLGGCGGIGILAGTVGLLWLKLSGDQAPAVRRQLGAELAVLALLAAIAASGLLLLALRTTGAMGVLLAIHLGFVLALFLVLPYSRMVHGLYRSAALLRNALEKKALPPIHADGA